MFVCVCVGLDSELNKMHGTYIKTDSELNKMHGTYIKTDGGVSANR